MHHATSPRLARTATTLGLLAALACAGSPPTATPSASLPTHWIDGTDPSEPAIQIHALDASTYVLRQSLRTNREGPFLYLFLGDSKALLVDSGAGGIDVAGAVAGLLDSWKRSRGLAALDLVVAHSHSHFDHVAGDADLARLPRTTVVGTAPEDVAAFFRFPTWPDAPVAFDLGGRSIDVLAIPGHEPAHLAFYDARMRVLVTGDTLYPGRLYVPIPDFDEYVDSVDRLVAFTETHPVRWMLGTHIEMSREPKVDFPGRATEHPNEHVLELTRAHLLELRDAVHAMQSEPHPDRHDDFIVVPLKPRDR